MHHDHLVFIRCYNSCCRSVSCHPSFLLADVKQYTVNTFFCRRARIQVVCKNFMSVFQTVMYADLFSFKVSMTERRCYINDCSRFKIGNCLCIYKGLKLCQSKGKKCSISRAYQNRFVSVFRSACHKRNHDQFLFCKPGISIFFQYIKVITIYILKTRLVRRLSVRNSHTVGISAAHIVFYKVHYCTVFAAYHIRFFYRSAVHIIKDIYLICSFISENQLI